MFGLFEDEMVLGGIVEEHGHEECHDTFGDEVMQVLVHGVADEFRQGESAKGVESPTHAPYHEVSPGDASFFLCPCWNT